MHHKIVAIVGLPGSGKTEAARFFEQLGFKIIRFGGLTDKLIRDNNLEPNEENERRMREFIRKKEGMEAYAKLHLEDIEKEVRANHVVIDGLYSWEEYLFLKKRFNEHLLLLAIYAPSPVRHLRLSTRLHRPLTKEEAVSRDVEEIEKLKVAGPIAIADQTIINIHTSEDLRIHINEFVKEHFQQ